MSTPRLSLTRTFAAPLDRVWALWTTKEGIEAWWGPPGFAVTVQALDLRPGGLLHYTMTATEAPQIAFMKQHGMPIATQTSLTYTVVEAPRRLAYENHVDFVPGHPVYDVSTVVELHEEAGSVRMVLSFDPMHDEIWTSRQREGWELEIGKLAAWIEANG